MASFSENLAVEGAIYPEQWRDTAGWTVDKARDVVALPKHVVYLSEHTVKDGDQERRFTGVGFYNERGETTTRSEEPKEIDVKSTELLTQWIDGKLYLLLVEQGTSKPSDGKPSGPTAILTGYTESGEKTFRQVAPVEEDTVYMPMLGALWQTKGRVFSWEKGGTERIIDPRDGKLHELPQDSEDSRWYGRVDGIDLFLKEASGLGDGDLFAPSKGWSLGEIDGIGSPASWSYGVHGPYISVYKKSEEGTSSKCLQIDARSGKEISGGDQLEGICYERGVHEQSEGENAPVQTAKAVIFATINPPTERTGNGVLFPETGKVYRTPEGGQFIPLSATDDGTVFGTMRNLATEAASIKVGEESEPRILDRVNKAPLAISGNGIAVFSARGNADLWGEGFVLKAKE